MSINIFGVVGEDVRASNIIQQIQDFEGDILEVNIMSPGGSVVEGLAIFDELMRFKGRVITRAMGQAASIASIIFMAGEEREIANNAEIMVHNAMVGVAGNKHELNEYVQRLNDIDQRLINIYRSRAGLKEEEIRFLLDKETFMNADEACRLGFATVKINALELVAQYNKKSIININKEPETMAEKENQEVEVNVEASEKKVKGFFNYMKAFFTNEDESKEPEMEEAKAEEVEEDSPENMEESEEVKDLKAKVENLEKELAEAKAEAEEKPMEAKEEAKSVAGLILDAMTDNKITMHEAKNLCSDSLDNVKAILEKKESNATGRGAVETPKDEPTDKVVDQYRAIQDPAERKAFFNKNKDEIINQSKES